MIISEPVSLSRGKILGFHESIENLDKTESRFLDDGASLLAQGLGRNQSLKAVCFSDCNLMDESLSELVKCLHHHPSLEELDISFNKCRSSGMGRLSGLLQHSRSLQRLSMGFQAFGEAKRIDLSSFAGVLESNTTTLKYLDLGGNSLRDDAMIPIANALCQNVTLETLDLSENRLSNRGVSTMVASMGGMHGLRRRVLENNRFDEVAIAELANALTVNMVLEDIEVEGVLKTSSGIAWRKLAYYLDLNWGGRRILFEARDVPLSLWSIILERSNNAVNYDLTREVMSADIVYIIARPILCCRDE